MLNCVVVLDKREFDVAASKYLAKPSIKTIIMTSDIDSDDDRLEIDETPTEASSMPNLDSNLVDTHSVRTKKGVSIEWASENNPMYGSAEFVPTEKKKRKGPVKKQFASSGTQYNKNDVQKICNSCIEGNAYRAQLELELAKRGTSIAELTGGGPIGMDLFEKVKALVDNEVNSKEVKRALPGLLPLPSILPAFNNNLSNETSNITSTFSNNNETRQYTEVDIRMSRFEYLPFTMVRIQIFGKISYLFHASF